MSANLTLSTSTEFMSNFKQVELLDQREKFEAVQTHDGHSIFIGMGTDSQLYAVIESSGNTHGWAKHQISKGLPGSVKTFEVSQNHKDGHIDIAVVMQAPSGDDSLYLASDLSATDTGWISNPLSWNAMRDDRQNPQNPKLVIVDVHLSEQSTGTESVVVDTATTNGFIDRYWIRQRGPIVWNAHDLAFDLSASKADKGVMGRKSREPVDGMYTMGPVGSAIQFVYTPLYNPFDLQVAPNPTNFDLSGTGITPDNTSFSATPAVSGEAFATDVFVGGAGSLYYYAAADQNQMAKPKKILSNPLLGSVRDLRASVDRNQVVIWVLNSEDQMFYLSCPKDKVLDAKAWSVPLPLQERVSEMAEYISQTGGITVFANVGNGLILKGMQDPQSSRWVFTKIELPTLDPKAAATKQLSFTTSIHVRDEFNKPVPNADVVLKPDARVNVYINNLFYALNGTELTVKTDTNGMVHIIEWVDTLAGTNFHVHLGDPTKAQGLNPLLTPLNKLGALTTTSGLDKAKVVAGDGTTSPLLTKPLNSDDKKALAQSINDLHSVHQNLSLRAQETGLNAGFTINATANISSPQSPINYIEAAWGDLVQAVKSFGKYVVQLVKDAASDVWHFVVTIAGKVYGFIVDTAEKIAGALEAIWTKIADGWKKFIEFVKFIFEWKDMVRTKDVFKQTVLIFFNRIAEEVQTARASMDTAIDQAELQIMKWANEPASSRPSIGNANQPMSKTLKGRKTPESAHSAPAQFIQHHFQSNVARSDTAIAAPKIGADPDWSGLTDLSDITKRSQDDIAALREHIKGLFLSAATQQDPNLEDILKKIVADIAILGMDLFKAAADKILDLLTLLMEEMVALLDAPIYIPILTDILKDDFGMTMPSILDILCYVTAIPTTIVYKVVKGKAPFSEDDTLYKNLSKAKSFADLKKLYNTTDDLITLDKEAQAVLFETTYFASGVATIINGFLVVLDEEVDGAAASALATPKTIMSVLSGGSLAIGGLFKLPTQIKNETMQTFASVVSKINILQMVCFIVAPKAIAKIKGISGDGPLKALGKEVSLVSSGVSAILAFIGLVPPVFNMFEIVIDGEALTKEGVLGLEDSTQNITGKLGKIVGFAALVDSEEISKQILILVQGILVVVTGGIQISESATEAIL